MEISREKLSLLRGKDIITAEQFSREEVLLVMDVAAHYERALLEKKRLADMEGKIMASLFFEPSTRTRLSFEAAMQRLGGSVITVAESPKMQTSSTAKGETLQDSIKVIDSYADVIVIRSPVKGAAGEAAGVAEHPVINAGDGTGQHPTQALLDLYTIRKEKGQVEGLTVGLLGDLKYGRTVHSLVHLLSMFGCRLIFISPRELAMPAEITAQVKARGGEVVETEDLGAAVREIDVLYVTRVQKERFQDPEEYERVKDSYVVDEKLLERTKPGMVIMHPLPRVSEIAVAVDSYPGAAYFRQAANGVPVRMALLALTAGNLG